MKGFFVPGSVSSSYVSSKRNEEGSFLYQGAANTLGLEKQAALQTLNKNYSQTISNAYSAYLAGNKGVLGSSMGQGYKEAYLQAQQDALTENIAQSNLNVASVKSELGKQENEATKELNKQFEEEVSNFDRLSRSFVDYKSYLETLSNDKGSYLTDEQRNMSVDALYDYLAGAQPQAYLDAEGNIGQPFEVWLYNLQKNTDVDRRWYQWLSGGKQEFLSAPKEREQYKYSAPMNEPVDITIPDKTEEKKKVDWQKKLSDILMGPRTYR